MPTDWHNFNPRSPSGLRLFSALCLLRAEVISIHAARVGCDEGKFMQNETNANFNPRSPSGLRLLTVQILKNDMQFQSTQPEWAATFYKQTSSNRYSISIHAARVGCDNGRKAMPTDWHNFNPRSPSGLRLFSALCLLRAEVISIHAARVGCDEGKFMQNETNANFNPRSPSGLRR